MAHTLTLGVDPGLTGALALTDGRGWVRTYAVPVVKVQRGNGLKTRLDVHKYLALCGAIAALEPVLALIEDVGGMPGQSAPAAFSFGYSAGVMAAGLMSAGVPVQYIPPATWKRSMGVPANKDAARALASQLMPTGAHLWPLVKDDGKAEAALLSLYAHRLLTVR